MSRSLGGDLENPRLFEENQEGAYTYESNAVGGKTAYGSLVLADDIERDPRAQLQAGGDARRQREHEWGHDDGGHLIAARFGGSVHDENLTAQDSNLNRGSYKRAENSWVAHLEAGDKVFVNLETAEGERPDAYMGYAIIEHPDGSREWETYSFVNESQAQIGQWEEEAQAAIDEDNSLMDDWDTSASAEDYSKELDDWGEDSSWASTQSSSYDQSQGMEL